MALTINQLVNDDRFSGDNVLPFLLYLPFGLILLATRTVLALVLWIASIILPNKSTVRQFLSVLACCTFGVYVKQKGKRDPRCSILVANYVSVLDSLAAAHTLGTISLRKWKVPPFFASSLGIRNASQFVRKQHFTECTSAPILLQPEGGPGGGRALLRFTDWPFPIAGRVQPVAITVERPFTNVTVHRPTDSRSSFPWSDALWFLWTPVTVVRINLLPAVEARDENALRDAARAAIAEALNIEMTDYTWEDMIRGAGPVPIPAPTAPVGEAQRLARQVKEVLPGVPMRDILRDLAQTRSVDVTITNFLEGITPYTPEVTPEPQPSTSASASTSVPPKYVTPVPTGVFPKNAKERQLGFQERKAQMIAEARQRYIEKHSLKC